MVFYLGWTRGFPCKKSCVHYSAEFLLPAVSRTACPNRSTGYLREFCKNRENTIHPPLVFCTLKSNKILRYNNFFPQSIIFYDKPPKPLGLKHLIHCSKESNSQTTILFGTTNLIPTDPMETSIPIMLRPKEILHDPF